MRAGRPTKNTRPSFGEHLALARQQAGLTQQQLADRLDTTQRVITFWERREESKKRGNGPVGRARRVLETVSRLPHHQQQQRIIDIVDALVAHPGGEERT